MTVHRSHRRTAWHLPTADRVGPLRENDVVGWFEPRLGEAFVADPTLVHDVARQVVTSQFPDTVASDVLIAAGLDPDVVLAGTAGLPDRAQTRRRDPGWRVAVLQAWDRQCAFCGYDGQVGGAVVGVDAAHVRWFAFGGPDTSDNGPALCVLHHKLFDLGALGLDDRLRIRVSQVYSARTDAGRLVYELHGRPLRPRPGTVVPSEDHLAWHDREVLKGVRAGGVRDDDPTARRPAGRRATARAQPAPEAAFEADDTTAITAMTP